MFAKTMQQIAQACRKTKGGTLRRTILTNENAGRQWKREASAKKAPKDNGKTRQSTRYFDLFVAIRKESV